MAALDNDFWDKIIWKVLSATSFLIMTTGFVWIAYTFVQHYLKA
jgi:hypothetical protein